MPGRRHGSLHQQAVTMEALEVRWPNYSRRNQPQKQPQVHPLLSSVRAGAKCHQNADLKSHLNAEAGCPS